jgi:hypothetical protein
MTAISFQRALLFAGAVLPLAFAQTIVVDDGKVVGTSSPSTPWDNQCVKRDGPIYS